jgi:hypothetical protein
MQMETIAFSPDSKALAGSKWNDGVRVWDIATSKEIFKLNMKSRYDLAKGVAFAPRGRYLATGHRDGTVRLWELASGRECQRFIGHDGSVCSVAFSPDGRHLASGAGDHTILVWDLTGRSGELELALRRESEDLERLWSDLAGVDARRAYRSGRILASVPDRAVELLRRRLGEPKQSANPLGIVLDRDSADYPELVIGEAAETRASSFEGSVPREKRLGPMFYENLRIVRSASVLEWIGTDQAKELLREIAERERQALEILNRELSPLP